MSERTYHDDLVRQLERAEARVADLTRALDPHDAARRIAEAVCGCGHRFRSHDPEDGDCDSFDNRALGKCSCRAFHSSSPDYTTAEVLARAVLGDAGVPDTPPKEPYSVRVDVPTTSVTLAGDAGGVLLGDSTDE